MVHALAHVQQLFLGDAQRRRVLQQDFEVARVGLVGARVLGGDDVIEGDVQACVAAGEGRPVDVRQDDEFEALPQRGQGTVAVAEGRPVSHRRAEGPGLRVADRDPGLGADAVQHGPQDVRVERAGRGALLLPFKRAEGGHEGGVIDLAVAAVDPVARGLQDAAFPIDQRAVAVKGQGAVFAVVDHGAFLGVGAGRPGSGHRPGHVVAAARADPAARHR